LCDEEHAEGPARGRGHNGRLGADADAADLLNVHAARHHARAVRQHELAAHVDAGVGIDLAVGNDPPVTDVHDRQLVVDWRRKRSHHEVATEPEASSRNVNRRGLGIEPRLAKLVVLAKRARITRRCHAGARKTGGDVIGRGVESR
jgi:hypothetical protein